MTMYREDVLNAIPPSAREGVLKMALDHNITDPSDPIWAMVGLAWSATTAANVARQSLTDTLAKMETATSEIPDVVLKSVQASGGDLAEAVAKRIDDRVVAAGGALYKSIEIAINRGASAYKEATNGLDKQAADKGAAFIESWKADVAKAVEAQARASLKNAIGVRWTGIATALAMAFAIGTVIGGLLLQTVRPTLAEVGARIVKDQIVIAHPRAAVWCQDRQALCVKPRFHID